MHNSGLNTMIKIIRSGVKLNKRIQAAYTDHFLRYEPLSIFNPDHLPAHLGPPNNRIEEFRSGDIGLGLLFVVGGGMKLGTISPDRFEFPVENGRYVVYEIRLVEPVLDKMKNVFGAPGFLFEAGLVLCRYFS